jgi:hypothetical protein
MKNLLAWSTNIDENKLVFCINCGKKNIREKALIIME